MLKNLSFVQHKIIFIYMCNHNYVYMYVYALFYNYKSMCVPYLENLWLSWKNPAILKHMAGTSSWCCGI